MRVLVLVCDYFNSLKSSQINNRGIEPSLKSFLFELAPFVVNYLEENSQQTVVGG